MSESTTPPKRYGPPSRGVTSADVERAADACLREGHRPTIDRIREKLGTGSPNTINPLLDVWWKRLGNRLDGGPAALHRLPEDIAQIAEALWLQALDTARRRAALEQQSTNRNLAQDKQNLEVRSHVLSLREGELESRLRDRERREAALEAQVQELTALLRKEQATRDSLAKRIADLENQLLAQSALPTKARRPRTPRTPTGKPQPRRAGQLRKPATATAKRKGPQRKARPRSKRR